MHLFKMFHLFLDVCCNCSDLDVSYASHNVAIICSKCFSCFCLTLQQVVPCCNLQVFYSSVLCCLAEDEPGIGGRRRYGQGGVGACSSRAWGGAKVDAMGCKASWGRAARRRAS
jgi:hypothetical protein